MSFRLDLSAHAAVRAFARHSCTSAYSFDFHFGKHLQEPNLLVFLLLMRERIPPDAGIRGLALEVRPVCFGGVGNPTAAKRRINHEALQTLSLPPSLPLSLSLCLAHGLHIAVVLDDCVCVCVFAFVK